MKCRIIINRHKSLFNRKNYGVLPEEPTISLVTSKGREYAYQVELTGRWVLKQDYEKSPCSGAHIWLEGKRKNVRVIERKSKRYEKEVDFF